MLRYFFTPCLSKNLSQRSTLHKVLQVMNRRDQVGIRAAGYDPRHLQADVMPMLVNVKHHFDFANLPCF